jgi:hypothetical protein
MPILNEECRIQHSDREIATPPPFCFTKARQRGLAITLSIGEFGKICCKFWGGWLGFKPLVDGYRG